VNYRAYQDFEKINLSNQIVTNNYKVLILANYQLDSEITFLMPSNTTYDDAKEKFTRL